MATNLKTRVEKLEQATTPANPPVWVKVLMATFGGIAEDYMPGGQVMGLEALVAGANEPDTAGGNRAESSLYLMAVEFERLVAGDMCERNPRP